MERITYYDNDFGNYFLINKKTQLSIKSIMSLCFKLINRIGELEDRVEELENGVNKETRGRASNSFTEI